MILLLKKKKKKILSKNLDKSSPYAEASHWKHFSGLGEADMVTEDESTLSGEHVCIMSDPGQAGIESQMSQLQLG